MTLFGIIWIGATIACFSRIKYLFALLLLSSVLQCSNVITVGDFAVGPQIITCVIFIARYMLSSHYELRRPNLINLSLSLFMLAILVSLLDNKVLSSNLLYFVQIGCYALCFMLVRNIGIDRKTVYKYILRITVFVLVVGAIQFLVTSGLFPRLYIFKLLFYNDNSNYVYYNSEAAINGQYYRLMSTFLEPSYCSCFFVAILFYLCSNVSIKQPREIALIAFIIIELFLTRSSTGYGALFVTGILFFIFTANREARRLVLLGGLITSVGVILFASDLILDVIINKGSSGSAIVRNQWDEQAYDAFLSSIIFGRGYKNIRGSSLFYSLLGQVGIVGSIFYYLFNLIVFMKVRVEGLRFALIAIITCQMIACPDLDLNSYWCVLWLIATELQRKDSKQKVNIANRASRQQIL